MHNLKISIYLIEEFLDEKPGVPPETNKAPRNVKIYNVDFLIPGNRIYFKSIHLLEKQIFASPQTEHKMITLIVPFPVWKQTVHRSVPEKEKNCHHNNTAFKPRRNGNSFIRRSKGAIHI